MFAAGIRELRDAVHRCPGGAEVAALGPQAHVPQMRAPGKLGKRAVLDDPGLQIHPHGHHHDRALPCPYTATYSARQQLRAASGMSVHEVVIAVCRWDYGFVSTPEEFFAGSPVLGWDADEKLLTAAGAQAEHLETGCCSLAGNSGFQVCHGEVSEACASAPCCPRLREAEPGAMVLADGAGRK